MSRSQTGLGFEGRVECRKYLKTLPYGPELLAKEEEDPEKSLNDVSEEPRKVV